MTFNYPSVLTYSQNPYDFLSLQSPHLQSKSPWLLITPQSSLTDKIPMTFCHFRVLIYSQKCPWLYFRVFISRILITLESSFIVKFPMNCITSEPSFTVKFSMTFNYSRVLIYSQNPHDLLLLQSPYLQSKFTGLFIYIQNSDDF